MHRHPQHWLIFLSLSAQLASLHAVSCPRLRRVAKPQSTAKGASPFLTTVPEDNPRYPNFLEVVLCFRLTRKKGAVSLGEASGVAPEKPEGT